MEHPQLICDTRRVAETAGGPSAGRWPLRPTSMDAIYHRTHLGDSLLHALQKLCVAGELEGAEARRIITDFNEVRTLLIRYPRFGDKTFGISVVLL